MLVTVYHGGAGRHTAALDGPVIIQYLKIAKATEYVYVGAVMFPKLAILALYLQVFTSKLYIRIVYACGAIITLNCIASWMVSTFLCRPFAYYWDRTIEGGHCGDIMAGYRAISVPSVVTDIAMLIMPIPILLKVQVPLVTKIGLLVTFLTASL